MTPRPLSAGLVVRSGRPAPLVEWYRDALETDERVVRIEGGTGLGPRACEPLRFVPTLLVDDMGEAERRLVSHGTPWLREVQATAWGNIATVLDPDGNVVQLLERT